MTSENPTPIEIKNPLYGEQLRQYYRLQQKINELHRLNPHRLLGVIPEGADQSPMGLAKLFENQLFSLSELIGVDNIDGVLVGVASSPEPLA